MRWRNYRGEIVTISLVGNEYLANIFFHMKKYYSSNADLYVESEMLEINQEIKRRKLSKDFLLKAPYPFQDPNTKEWLLWDVNTHKNVKIPLMRLIKK